jgi:rhodanese-related sulfurtransferase
MKNFKRIMALCFVLSLLATLSACKKEDTTAEQTMDLKQEVTTEEKEVAPVEESLSVEQRVKDTFATMPEHIYKIGQEDFLKKVVAGDDMVIVDIRSAADYEASHVKGAINLPWGGTAISDGLKFLPQDKDVFIYCVSGQTAGQAVITMNVVGINARSVNLGYKFGIAKTEGYSDVINETTINPLGNVEYPIDSAVQEAIDLYYSGMAEFKDTPFASYKVPEDHLKAMMDNKEDFYLLSARSAEDYAKEHIEGAVNVPFAANMLENLGNVPKDKKVVVYCYSGQTAGQAVAAMRLLGYDAVSLNGGMGVSANAPMGWKNQGYTVVSASSVYNGVVNYFKNMPEHIYKIGEVDFLDKVKAGEDMVVIDIRSAADYEVSHVKGAINLPWGGTAISDGLKSIPQDKDVFIYCVSGQTAGQAVMTMNIAGINARSVNLGYKFGISKTEGYSDLINETTANVFGSETYAIDAEIQGAIDAYYAGFATVKETQYASYMVAEENLATMIDMNEDFYLLSIRKAEDYAKGHIKGAVNVPFNNELINNLGSVPKDKKIVVYCYSGQTAGQTVAAMRLLGYDAVSLRGGIGVPANAPLGWTNTGRELVTN